MGLLFDVVEDLTSFAYDALRGFFLGSPKIENPDRVLNSRPEYTVLPASTLTAPPREMKVYTPQLTAAREEKDLQKSTVMYTASLATPVRSEPGILGDTIYTVLPYGAMVMVLEVRDLWARVASGEYTGWVYTDDLEDRAAHVYPDLQKGERYDESDPATERLRALIGDEFGAGELALPLQMEEYVLYRLKRKGVHVEWPHIRPRTPGTWADILGTTAGVKISSEPAAGSIIEYTLPQDGEERKKGCLMYVEAVFPDQSFQVSGVGCEQEGVFSERVFTEEKWRLVRPVFLSFHK